jgi:hypothetical protein
MIAAQIFGTRLPLCGHYQHTPLSQLQPKALERTFSEGKPLGDPAPAIFPRFFGRESHSVTRIFGKMTACQRAF